MRLIHRTKLSGHFEADIEKYCLGDKISDSGHYEFDPAYVDTLRSDAKTWIKDTAGYAILSHRWGSNELAFSDISQFENIVYGPDQSPATIKSTLIPKKVTDLAKGPRQTPYAEFELLEAMTVLCDSEEFKDYQGFVKIIQFFTMSRKYNCNLVWFDTGCIDKDSSAELEESIRSMFNWYRNSKICIIYLSGTSNAVNIESDPWFTRGWTLQELLAPPRVKFVDSSWKPLTCPISFDDDDKLVRDSKQKKNFWEHVLYITQISDEHIANFKPGVHHASNALRWMARRETTRDEDMAYCLISLLGIPLTIAYGERMEAFYRLQVEILHHMSDMGLFAWLGCPATKNSMLASEPKCFLQSVAIKSLFDNDKTVPIAITGHGLYITLLTYEVTNPEDCRPSDGLIVQLKIKGLHSIYVVLGTINKVGSGTRDNDNSSIEFQSMDGDNDFVESQNTYNKVELAVLGTIRGSQPTKYLAILLGFYNDQCKRIPTKDFVKVSLPKRENWPKPNDFYIQ